MIAMHDALFDDGPVAVSHAPPAPPKPPLPVAALPAWGPDPPRLAGENIPIAGGILREATLRRFRGNLVLSGRTSVVDGIRMGAHLDTLVNVPLRGTKGEEVVCPMLLVRRSMAYTAVSAAMTVELEVMVPDDLFFGPSAVE